MTTLVERLRAKSSRLYGIRDRIGIKSPVFHATVTWQGTVGEGAPTLAYEQILPTPGITNLSTRRALSGHGETAEGDLMLTGIAYDKYGEEYFKNGNGMQRFWLIKGQTYTTENVELAYVSWKVMLKISKVNWWTDIAPTV